MAKRKPKPAVNQWPARLQALKVQLGLTQAEIAARLHISQSQWSSFITGKRLPTRPVAFLIELLEDEKI